MGTTSSGITFTKARFGGKLPHIRCRPDVSADITPQEVTLSQKKHTHSSLHYLWQPLAQLGKNF
jgi:hypothetical protein